MRSLSTVLVTLVITLSAWPRSAAAWESPCRAEFDGCAVRLDAPTPVAALKCIDGFQACARECASVNICQRECRASRVTTAPHGVKEWLGRWFDLGPLFHVPARPTVSARR